MIKKALHRFATGVPPVSAGPAEAGSSTAEVAVLLPAVALFLVFGLGVGAVSINQVQLQEGVRAGARELARGENAQEASAAVRRHAGQDAEVSVNQGGEFSSVHASQTMRIPGLGTEVLTLEASAEARTEATSHE